MLTRYASVYPPLRYSLARLAGGYAIPRRLGHVLNLDLIDLSTLIVCVL